MPPSRRGRSELVRVFDDVLLPALCLKSSASSCSWVKPKQQRLTNKAIEGEDDDGDDVSHRQRTEWSSAPQVLPSLLSLAHSSILFYLRPASSFLWSPADDENEEAKIKHAWPANLISSLMISIRESPREMHLPHHSLASPWTCWGVIWGCTLLYCTDHAISSSSSNAGGMSIISIIIRTAFESLLHQVKFRFWFRSNRPSPCRRACRLWRRRRKK